MNKKVVIALLTILFLLTAGCGIGGYFYKNSLKQTQNNQNQNLGNTSTQQDSSEKTEVVEVTDDKLEDRSEDEDDTNVEVDCQNKTKQLEQKVDFYGKELTVKVYSCKDDEYYNSYREIYDNGKLLISDYPDGWLDSPSEIKEYSKNYYTFDYFLDSNGKKHIILNYSGTGGGGFTVYNIDTGEEIFDANYEDIGNYNYNQFKDLETEIGVSLSKYFENGRFTHQHIINDKYNLISYFYLDSEDNTLSLREVRIEKGELKYNKEVIKKLDKNLESSFPILDTTIDEKVYELFPADEEDDEWEADEDE